MAVVTFLPVTPWAQAAATFKSNLGLPPFWPVFFKYHWCWKRGSVGSSCGGRSTKFSTFNGLYPRFSSLWSALYCSLLKNPSSCTTCESKSWALKGSALRPWSKASRNETQGDFLDAVNAKSSAESPAFGSPNPRLTRRNPVCWTACATCGSALRRRRWPTLRLLRAWGSPWWMKWYSCWEPNTGPKLWNPFLRAILCAKSGTLGSGLIFT